MCMGSDTGGDGGDARASSKEMSLDGHFSLQAKPTSNVKLPISERTTPPVSGPTNDTPHTNYNGKATYQRRSRALMQFSQNVCGCSAFGAPGFSGSTLWRPCMLWCKSAIVQN